MPRLGADNIDDDNKCAYIYFACLFIWGPYLVVSRSLSYCVSQGFSHGGAWATLYWELTWTFCMQSMCTISFELFPSFPNMHNLEGITYHQMGS